MSQWTLRYMPTRTTNLASRGFEHMSRAEHGFTLIELLICIFIMSIMGVSIALSINQVIRSSEVSGQRLQEIRDLAAACGLSREDIIEMFSVIEEETT